MFKRFFSKQSSTLLKRAVLQPKPFLMPTALLAKPFTPVTRVISHPFSTNTPVFKTKTEATQSFRHISNDQFSEAYESSTKLAELDNSLMAKIITYYVESIFKPEQLKTVPDFIADAIKEAEIENLSKNPRALGSELFNSLKTLTEFLDKSERGFLTGDLNPKLVLNLQKYVGELLVKNLPSEREEILQDKRNIMVYECFDKIARNCFDGIFRLPIGGIPHPDGENPRNMFERQLILEDESNEIAVEKFLNVYDDLQTLGLSFNLSFARNYIVDWFPNLTRAIKEEQEQCLLGDQKGDRKHYGPYLTKISSEKAALIALTELMKSVLKLTHKKKDVDEIQAYHIISKIMFDTIGKAINAQVIFDFEEEMAKARDKTEKQAREESGEPDMGKKKKGNTAARQAALSQKILKKKLSLDTYQSIGIPKSIQIKMGSLLVYLMKETIKVKNEEGFWQNLLTTGYTKVKGKAQYVGILNINEQFLLDLIGKIEKSDSLFIQIDRSLPMVFKPAPWQDHEMGGYYQKPTNFMRIQESHLQERSIKYADLQPTFDVLDILSQTPWRINRRVLKTIEQIWEEGGGAGEIPVRYYNYKNYIYDYQVKECRDQAEKAKLSKKVQLQRDMHSLRCDFSLKLNVAKAFEDIEKFYFPHNIDFRGRIYPVPPHLNHIQADICRGLLEFSEGKPIGPNGLTWLKIHLANKMGKDKLSFDERITYAESMIPIVEKVVQDPLANRQWLEAEDSWQTLAAMYDLSDALSNPNPETHISHLHIHQDGSCNGLQHYAALGRDFAGATQVNLMHSERPGDVYTHVANMVEAKVERDAKDTASKYHDLAKKLSGNIKRKIVKQTVMTSVYGVTFIGARKQIHKQLKDKEFIDESEGDKELYAASHYIALLTLDAIRDLFSGAHEIKKWLIQCAALIANTSNPVSWITPFGLPIIQPYRTKKNIDVISTIIQSVTVSVDTDDLPINKSKQRSAFPPNFIHSLDSTHLMYTALECNKEGITFAAVHDSYWTHAGTIDRMNELLRDQFVKLHSQPLLENLKQSFERRYPEIEFPEIPTRGDFELEKVKDSMYFFA